jgi:hypothetical protein
VQQTAEQAVLEGVSLSDLEKRMMYFTESDSTSCADPIQLNEEFEAQYDTTTYEAKMSGLLHRCDVRLKEEDPEKVRNWNESIGILNKGDHYLLVLWRTEPPSGHPVRDFFKPVGIGILIAFGIGMAIFVWVWLHNPR